MAVRYQDVGISHFVVQTNDGHEEIVIRARRPVLPSVFISVWLCAWTYGGLMAMREFMAVHQLFLAIWLCGWAAAWLVAAVQLAWMLSGRERVAVIDRSLELRYAIAGLTLRRVYRGRDIRALTAVPASLAKQTIWYSRPLFPFWSSNTSGSFKFFYGARTVFAGFDLDEPDARLVVARLAKTLPAQASETNG